MSREQESERGQREKIAITKPSASKTMAKRNSSKKWAHEMRLGNWWISCAWIRYNISLFIDIFWAIVTTKCHAIPISYVFNRQFSLALFCRRLRVAVAVVIDDRRMSTLFTFTSHRLTNFAWIFFFVSINSIITVWCFSNPLKREKVM